MRKGYFITFEGIDGCGKSTQARQLSSLLHRNGYSVTESREPGGTPLAEKIRAVLIDPENDTMTGECELLLYLAARAQHVREKIIPALAEGSVIICDRFQDATFAYQGYGRGISLELLSQFNSFAAGIIPDLTFIFDISVAHAFDRLQRMHKSQDRLESSGKEFFEKIRLGYLSLAKREPERIILLDGTLSVATLSEMVYGAVMERLGNFSKV